MRTKLIPLLLISFILCACVRESPVISETSGSVAETQIKSSIIPTTEASPELPTISPSIPSTEFITEPDLSISVSSGEHSDTFTDEQTGDYLEYILNVPENAEKGMPLVIYLHGDGSVGQLDSVRSNAFITKTTEIYGANFPYIILSPCTRITSWITWNIPTTLKALIDHIVLECEIDPNRIILTGFSRGSIGVWHMISNFSDYFSAAVAISCGHEGSLNIENCCKVPLRCFAGNGDQTEVSYYFAMERNVTRIADAGGDAQIILLEGKLHRDTPYEAYTQDTIEWMLAQ